MDRQTDKLQYVTGDTRGSTQNLLVLF